MRGSQNRQGVIPREPNSGEQRRLNIKLKKKITSIRKTFIHTAKIPRKIKKTTQKPDLPKR